MNPTNRLVYFIYFTCARHYPYFSRSLKSMAALRAKEVGAVYAYVDEHDYLSAEQLESVQRLMPGIKIFKSKTLTGWGEQSVEVITGAFTSLARDLPPECYVAKIDSDVIFRGGKFFADLFDADADYQGCSVNNSSFMYPVGGCYFLKARLAARLGELNLHAVCEQTLQRVNASGPEKYANVPEDAAMQVFVNLLGGKTRFMPDYSKCIMHFAGTAKSEMLKYDNKLYWSYKYHIRPFIGSFIPDGIKKRIKS